MTVEDQLAIERLKYRYLRAVDLRLWDELADTLAEEATATYGSRLRFDSRDAIVAGLREQMTDGVLTEHQAHHPEIDVDEDTATGRWYLQDRVMVPSMHVMIVGGAFYEDRYICRDGRWLITHTGYVRTYEASIDLRDVGSFRLLENHLAPKG